jgi:hypothetical protein
MIIIRPIEIPPNDVDAPGATLTASNVPATASGEAEWSAMTTYAIGDIVTVLGTTQRRYESLANGNLGNDPTTSPLQWLDLGATNRWRMFDGGTSTLTTNAESIDVTIEANDFVNGIALLNVSGSKIRIVITPDGESAPVFDQEAEFLIGIGESNWWSWFFGSTLGIVDELRDHVVLSLPQLFSPTVRIIIERPGGIAEAGLIVVGRQQELAVGIYGSRVGIRDFSTKEIDTFGNFRVVERRFAKRAEIDFYAQTQQVASLQRALASRRASPTVYIGSASACLFCPLPIRHEELIIYGFYADFDIILQDRENSSGTIELEGL